MTITQILEKTLERIKLYTDNKFNLEGNADSISNRIGNLELLNTNDKSNLVNAINEIHSKL